MYISYEDVEIKVTAKTDIVGSKATDTIHIEKECWDESSNEEKDKMILEHVLTSMVEWDYEEI